MTVTSVCPKCQKQVLGPFPDHCPHCSFNLLALTGLGTTSFQVSNWAKHSALLQGKNIPLAKNQIYNASFDFNGFANLKDIVRFTITYGDRVDLQSSQGGHINPAIVAYIPETLGAGTAIHFPGTVPCSGICLVSPHSDAYAHSYPIIDDWVKATFPNSRSYCRLCGSLTAFGQPICENCYTKKGSDWKNFI
jgi:hypothetical protein